MKCPNDWCKRTEDKEVIKEFGECLMCEKIRHDAYLENRGRSV